MSTEHQRYSTQNQADAIAKYAQEHGMTIVRTFTDDGKSGLNLDGRAGLLQLLSEVQHGQADFSAVQADLDFDKLLINLKRAVVRKH